MTQRYTLICQYLSSLATVQSAACSFAGNHVRVYQFYQSLRVKRQVSVARCFVRPFDHPMKKLRNLCRVYIVHRYRALKGSLKTKFLVKRSDRSAFRRYISSDKAVTALCARLDSASSHLFIAQFDNQDPIAAPAG